MQLTSAGRLGVRVATSKSDQPVLVDTEGKTMCMHGERPPSIQAWLNAERADPEYKRPSICTCKNLDGLLTDYSNVHPPKLPSNHASLYMLLSQIRAEHREINGRPQRLAVTTPQCEIWIQPAGTIVCKHGNTRKMLAKMSRARAANDTESRYRRSGIIKCTCTLNIPRRHGSIFAKLNTGELRASALRDTPF